MHPNAIPNFTTSFGLFRNPLFALSEVVGNHLWSLGFDASFDVTTQSFRSMDFASSLISDKFIASFNRLLSISLLIYACLLTIFALIILNLIYIFLLHIAIIGLIY